MIADHNALLKPPDFINGILKKLIWIRYFCGGCIFSEFFLSTFFLIVEIIVSEFYIVISAVKNFISFFSWKIRLLQFWNDRRNDCLSWSWSPFTRFSLSDHNTLGPNWNSMELNISEKQFFVELKISKFGVNLIRN